MCAHPDLNNTRLWRAAIAHLICIVDEQARLKTGPYGQRFLRRWNNYIKVFLKTAGGRTRPSLQELQDFFVALEGWD